MKMSFLLSASICILLAGLASAKPRQGSVRGQVKGPVIQNRNSNEGSAQQGSGTQNNNAGGARQGGSGGQGGPCAADAEKFCPNMQPGSREFNECLKSHQDKVSDACKAVMKSGRPGPGPDANNGGDEAGQGSTQRQGPSLRNDNGNEGGARQGGSSRQGPPCMDDAKKFCPNMQPGSREFNECLQSHKDQVSDECKDAMKSGRPGGRQGQ